MVKALNYKVTCKNVYELMSTGIVVGIVASFIPGLKSPRKVTKTFPNHMF